MFLKAFIIDLFFMITDDKYLNSLIENINNHKLIYFLIGN